MTTIILIILAFVLSLSMSYIEDRLQGIAKYGCTALLALFLILTAGLKPIGLDPDSLNYEIMFYEYDSVLRMTINEPSFTLIAHILNSLGCSVAPLFLIYATLSVSLRIWALSRLTPNIFTAITLYIPVGFLIQDLIQIRCAAAAGFILLSLSTYLDKRYKTTALLFVSAVLFHYSSLVFLPFYFFGDKPISRITRYIMASLIPIGFALYFAHKDLFILLPSSIIDGKIGFYKEAATIGFFDEDLIPHKNIYFLAKCAFFYLLLFYYERIKDIAPHINIIMRITAASLFIFLSMATVPVIASRISELYGIVDPLLFCCIFYILSPKVVARSIACLIGTYTLLFNLFIAKFLG